MSESLRRWLIVGGVLLVLAAVNVSIWQKEKLIEHGTPVSLALVPVDPRSLMQGDYMALEWQVSHDLTARYGLDALPESGTAVLGFEVGTTFAKLRRLDDGTPLAADEVRLEFRVRQGYVRIVTDAYFFQEGHAKAFERARFGSLRVASGGTAILVGMEDEALRPIVPDASDSVMP